MRQCVHRGIAVWGVRGSYRGAKAGGRDGASPASAARRQSAGDAFHLSRPQLSAEPPLGCRGRAVPEQGALKEVLRRSFRYTAAVSLQWVLFGSGGHRDRPAGGQLASFDRCTGTLSKQMKCLGSAYWFHKTATFRPKRTQQCTMRCAPPALGTDTCMHGIGSLASCVVAA